ncbi:MAG: hypothetical protein JW769_01725 [Parachlamydiales bacterium]|nr:hypothetical protein [Parachlamydiales bacterium]
MSNPIDGESRRRRSDQRAFDRVGLNVEQEEQETTCCGVVKQVARVALQILEILEYCTTSRRIGLRSLHFQEVRIRRRSEDRED